MNFLLRLGRVRWQIYLCDDIADTSVCSRCCFKKGAGGANSRGIRASASTCLISAARLTIILKWVLKRPPHDGCSRIDLVRPISPLFTQTIKSAICAGKGYLASICLQIYHFGSGADFARINLHFAFFEPPFHESGQLCA